VLQPAESFWIEPLVLALYRPTVQLATLLVRDYTVAQDIVQEAFVRVWLSPRTPREMSAFRPWLYKTVVNLARDHHRRQGRWARLRFGRVTSSDPTHIAEQRESEAALGTAMRGLSRREQEAVYVRFFEDAPFDEVGRIIGVRTGTARVLVHRALAKLREHLLVLAEEELPTP
jgi:RNA polymerase sigma-70 factor (ECF subfamily)